MNDGRPQSLQLHSHNSADKLYSNALSYFRQAAPNRGFRSGRSPRNPAGGTHLRDARIISAARYCQPFNVPAISPDTKYRPRKTKMISGGMEVIIAPAIWICQTWA